MGLILNGTQLNGAAEDSPDVGSVRLCDPHHSCLRMQKVGGVVGTGWTVQQIFQAVPTSISSRHSTPQCILKKKVGTET